MPTSDESPGHPALEAFDVGSSGGNAARDPNPPTVAHFSPSSTAPASRSTYQVTQKSPLLVATPPQITRALSQSYPYINLGNMVMGLLTWTTKDPWESFLVVAVFWAAALYGETLLLYGGNVLAVLGLALGMFLRRVKNDNIHPSLDQILETLQTFTARMNIFFDPFYRLTQFLSTGRTPTTSTTAPAVTTLVIRMVLLTPLWLFFAVWPFHIITSRRIILVTGTVILSWHSRPAKVTRTIIWRSLTVRWICENITGLTFTLPDTPPPLPPRRPGIHTPRSQSPVGTRVALAATTTNAAVTPGPAQTTAPNLVHKSTPLQPGGATSPGVRFTFVIYENQRRWLGIGWNTSLFAYERAPWTDESLEPCPPPAEFKLPETPKGSGVKWRWVAGEDWRVDGQDPEGRKSGHGRKQSVKDKLGGSGPEGEGWIYYDNKWNHGTRDGGDGWGKYTRRRKWVRNAELVEDHHHYYHTNGNGNGKQKSLDGASSPPPPYPQNTPNPQGASHPVVPAITVTDVNGNEGSSTAVEVGGGVNGTGVGSRAREGEKERWRERERELLEEDVRF